MEAVNVVFYSDRKTMVVADFFEPCTHNKSHSSESFPEISMSNFMNSSLKASKLDQRHD